METFLVDQNLSIKIPPASVPYIQDMVSHYQTCALRAPSIAHPNSPMIHQANAFVGTPALRSRDLTHGNGRSLNLGHRHQAPLLEEGLPSGSFSMTSPAQYANLPPKPQREHLTNHDVTTSHLPQATGAPVGMENQPQSDTVTLQHDAMVHSPSAHDQHSDESDRGSLPSTNEDHTTDSTPPLADNRESVGQTQEDNSSLKVSTL